jgi:hypothetical protein
MAGRIPFARNLALVAGVVALVALAFTGPATAHDHGRFDHGEPAGKIASFDPSTGTLTIELASGGSETGTVTDQTWIDAGDHFPGCDDRGRGRHARCWDRRHGDRGGDDHGHGWGHWHHGPSGSTDDLVPGTVVDDALLFLKDGRAWFAKIDLAG